MEESTGTAATAAVETAALATIPTLMQKQQHLFQQQLFLLRQYQQQQQQHQYQQQQQSQSQSQSQQPQSQQQQAISRFPSNIDAHLRAPGLRSLQQQQQQQQHATAHQLQLQQQAAKAAAVRQGGNPVEVEMAHQDAMKVCNPDFKRPFVSIEDVVLRLLPYHVVSDFEAEEDDRALGSDTTGQVSSRLQQWDHNILAKIAEFTTTFEKQVLAFNIMCKKRALGEFRSEERLTIEQVLLQEEKHAVIEIRAEMESRERASREAAEAEMRMAMAQAEQSRAEAQAHGQTMVRVPAIRANTMGSHSDNHSGGQDGWGNNSNNNNNGRRDDEEPSEDFLNDENELGKNGEEAGSQGEWRESGEFDLNTR